MENEPILLRPSGKDYLWGGNRLNVDFGKVIPLSPWRRHGSAPPIRTAQASRWAVNLTA